MSPQIGDVRIQAIARFPATHQRTADNLAAGLISEQPGSADHDRGVAPSSSWSALPLA
jgi:hypothetical protein